MTRIFTATLFTETNTFASFPTGLADYRARFWAEPEQGGIEALPHSSGSAPTRHWLKRARALGWEVVEGLHARTAPSGTTTRDAYEYMRDRILADLAAAGPVDAILLNLHGAMVAEGYDDCEGDLVSRIRQLVGRSVRIGIELDLHAHINETLVQAADVIVFFKAYPHIDYVERAEDVFRLIERTLAGEIEPVMALFDCRVMGIFPCTREGPMIGFTQAMFDAEGKDGILSLSLNHGFPWADVPLAGAKMLAIADRDVGRAKRAAEEFGRRFYDGRAESTLPFTPFDEAIAEAKRGGDKPLLLADTADQIGSGAPGDTTHILRALIEAGITSAAIVPLWDPEAVAICFGAGQGARLHLRIGGKFEPHSGPSLEAEAEVLLLKRDSYQPQIGGDRMPIGDVAVVRVAGIEVMLTSARANVYLPEIFAMHGIDLAGKQVIAIKNLYKHSDVFAPLVRKQLYVASPGTSNPDWRALPFHRIPRPMWPFDADPLGRESGPAKAAPTP